MRDRIYVKDFKKTIEIGAFQEERSIMQDVLFHVEVELEPQRTNLDIVDDILSYDVIVDAINDTLASKRYNLLETMAEDIAARILRQNQVHSVSVSIEKLGRIDGKLGITIVRNHTRKTIVNASDDQKVEFVAIDASSKRFAPSKTAQVIIPIWQEFPKNDETARRIYALKNDALAWEIAKHINMPVVDTKVEAQSLISRGMSFVRALGKQPFDQIPVLEDYSTDGLIAWHKEQLGATSIHDFTEATK